MSAEKSIYLSTQAVQVIAMDALTTLACFVIYFTMRRQLLKLKTVDRTIEISHEKYSCLPMFVGTNQNAEAL